MTPVWERAAECTWYGLRQLGQWQSVNGVLQMPCIKVDKPINLLYYRVSPPAVPCRDTDFRDTDLG